MTGFEFATAGRILFGSGTLETAPIFEATKAGRFLVLTGKTQGRAARLLDLLEKQDLLGIPYGVEREPTLHTVAAALKAAGEMNAEGVIGFGGGSVLDTAKAVAALLTNPGEIFRYLEVVGEGKPLENPPAPCIAIPTTAGTGAEVTRNAVIGVPEKGVKVSLRSPLMLPNLAVVDPELTLTMPPAVTAATGMDALTQLLEAYVSARANPMTDGFCREGLMQAAGGLLPAYLDGTRQIHRERMALASLLGGLALANAGLGAVHGIAGPLGGLIGASHGSICARLLPFVMEANLSALASRAPESPALTRYREIAQILTGSISATPGDGVQWLHHLCAEMNIPRLADLGLTEKMLPGLVGNAGKASSMRTNPVVLAQAELMHIIKAAL